MINKFLSDKLKAISFLLMLMVVFIHAYNLKIRSSIGIVLIEKGYNSFIQDLTSRGITRVAVPLFFAISGYLFFISFKDGSLSEFIAKYKKRGKTLVLPYLLWSVYGILLYFVLQLVPFSEQFFTEGLVVDYSFGQLLNRIFIDPIPYQLWFIRDLIVLIIFSPILFWLVKYLRFYLIFILFITWFCQVDYVIFSNEALTFFALGSFLGINKIDIQRIKVKKKNLWLGVIWILLLLVKTSLEYTNIGSELLIRILHKSSILIGIISIWLAYDVFFEKIDIEKKRYYKLFNYTFFLYAFHEPVLIMIRKALYFVLGQSETSSFLIYILAPTVTILISILIGSKMKKFTPKCYYLMTGGR